MFSHLCFLIPSWAEHVAFGYFWTQHIFFMLCIPAQGSLPVKKNLSLTLVEGKVTFFLKIL